MMLDEDIHLDYYGWWRIIETSQWVNDGLDILGTALISFTDDDDRLRMHCLLAEVTCWQTKTGVSFTWHGAWEYDPKILKLDIKDYLISQRIHERPWEYFI